MILNQKQNYIAYRCPRCASAATGFVGEFSLSADMLKLRCPCKESEMSITRTSDKKIRLSVPCIFCNKSHGFVVSQEVFFGKDLFLLNCPYTNMDICFIGKEQAISEAIERNTEDLNLLFSELGYDNIEQILSDQRSAEDMLPDVEIYNIVRFIVSELHADKKISCECKDSEPEDYGVDFVSEGVRVFCPDCNAEYVFPTDSIESAKDFLECDYLALKKKD